MLLHRVLTALAGIPVVLACIWFGPPWITILAAVAAVLGVREAYRLWPGGKDSEDEHEPAPTARLPILLGATWAVALVLAGQLAERPEDFGWAALVICVVAVVIAALWMVAAWHGSRPIAGAAYLVMSPIYIGGALASAAALRGIDGVSRPWWPSGETEAAPNAVETTIEDDGISEAYEIGASAANSDGGFWILPDLAGSELARDVALLTESGCWWLLMGILTVYAADTGAYAVGRLIGRHRMAPRVSPGKTWEGTAGGLLSAVAATVVLGALFPLKLDIWQLLIIGVILGAISPVGDLLESKLKRMADAKDSGNLFPGHGGMLDRLDSLLPSLIVVYVLAALSTS